MPVPQAASQGKAQLSHTPTVTEFQQSGTCRLKSTEGNAARTKQLFLLQSLMRKLCPSSVCTGLVRPFQTRVPPPLPLTVGSSVAWLAEALHVGSLVDTANSKTEMRMGTQGGAVTPDVVPGELVTHCGLLGPRVRGHEYGLGTRTRLALGHMPWFQWLNSEAKEAIPSWGAYLLEATERGHGHPTHCRGSWAEGLPM